MEGLRPTLYVPMRAFALATRDLGSQGGANLVGLIKPQDIGVIGWSAVVRSGSTILGPLRENISVWHTSNLPPAARLPETGRLTPTNPSLQASALSPKRIGAQTIFSRQLFIQSASTVALDQYVAAEIARSLSARLDQVCLYGSGAGRSAPGSAEHTERQ